MEPFTTLTAKVVALPTDHIDTDQIIPARYLKTISKAGLGANLFADWRYDAEGRPNADFAQSVSRFSMSYETMRSPVQNTSMAGSSSSLMERL